MLLISQMEPEIIFRTLIEVIGKPKEHIEEAIRDYVKDIRNNKDYHVVSLEISKSEKQEKSDLWSVFAELEIGVKKLEHLTAFCFNFMPSIIEVLKPEELKISQEKLSMAFNDLQSKLHQVDLVAKNMRLEKDHLQQNMANLLRNYITVMLTNRKLSSEQLSKLTGLSQDVLEDFMDKLIDKGKVDLKDGLYYLTGKSKE